jgi:hypothetical protein
MVNEMLDLAALVVAGMIGALVAQPAKVPVRVTADRARRRARRN